jgi:hypothetical protein
MSIAVNLCLAAKALKAACDDADLVGEHADAAVATATEANARWDALPYEARLRKGKGSSGVMVGNANAAAERSRQAKERAADAVDAVTAATKTAATSTAPLQVGGLGGGGASSMQMRALCVVAISMLSHARCRAHTTECTPHCNRRAAALVLAPTCRCALLAADLLARRHH